MRSVRWWWISVTASLLACQNQGGIGVGNVLDPTEEGRELDDREVVASSVMPPPISGGTLLVLDEGSTAVAADPDRDLIHVVDLDRRRELHAIALAPGDEPGRLVADTRGVVHVATRRGGVIVALDPGSGEVIERRAVCANPRGIAYEAETDQLHVACVGGDLVSLPAAGGPASRRIGLGPDLRDVVVTPEGLLVTHFRSAHADLLDEDGAVVAVLAPPTMAIDDRRGRESLLPNSAWRTVATPGGDWLMLHQVSTNAQLSIEPVEPDGGDEGGGGYGGDPDRGCGAVVHSMLTLGDASYTTSASGRLANTVLPVDVAISASGGRIALAVAGRRDDVHDARGVVWIDPHELDEGLDASCRSPKELPVGPGQFTAVAFDPQGRIVAQSREPASLVRVDPWGVEATVTIGLSGDARRDTGHDLFHRDAGRGIACASCHPEGGDDGHVWAFADTGLRHTPALTAGLADSQPFHWEGDLPDVAALVDDVHVGRMGGRPQTEPRVDALEAWIFSIRPPHPKRARDDAAAQRGAAAFTQWGCDGCHRGPALDGGPDNVWIGFEYSLQVPALRGVTSHPPYMHDGRAPDLAAAVLDMLARTRPQQPRPSRDELADMVAFLESR